MSTHQRRNESAACLLLLFTIFCHIGCCVVFKTTNNDELSLNVMSNQITSRLPFGEIEKLVYSMDRRELLHPTNSSIKPLFDYGSDEFYYYMMLQIDNEIEMEIKNDINGEDYDKIKSLQKEFDSMTDDIIKSKIKGNRLKELIFQNKLRFLDYFTLYNDINTKQSLIEILNIYLNETQRINPIFDFSQIIKPLDHSKGMESNKKNKNELFKQIISTISEHEINEYLLESMRNYNIESIVTINSISWLLKHKEFLKYKIIRHILIYWPSYIVLYEDECIDLLKTAINYVGDKTKDENEKILQFVSVYNEMTIEQLAKIEYIFPAIKQEIKYIEIYLKKLIPIELGLYFGENWQRHDIIPIDLKWKYVKILLEFVMNEMEAPHISSKAYGPFTSLRLYIYYQYMIFLEENYLFLDLNNGKDEKYPYDFGIFTNFLNIWNDIKNRKREHSTYFYIRPSFSFMSIFSQTPLHSEFNSFQFMKRCIKYGFTQNGKKYFDKTVWNWSAFNEFKKFTNLFDEQQLKRLQIEAMAINGEDVDLTDTNIQYVATNSLIEFDAIKNPSYFQVNDDVKLYVNIRNINDLMVKIFEINTKSYYRDNNDGITTNLNVNGLSPSFEWIISSKQIAIKSDYHIKQITIDFPKELKGKRGIYFIDLMSNGIQSRGIITIGNIDKIDKICSAGHLFQLFDETGNIIKNGSILLDKHVYETDKDINYGILIPFSTKQRRFVQNIILQNNENPNFNVLSSFFHSNEDYSFSASFYIDREQLLSNRFAKLIIKSMLYLHWNKENRVSVSLLQNVKLWIKMQTGNAAIENLEIDKTFDNFKLYDDKDSEIIFKVPNNLKQIEFLLTCQIEKISMSDNFDTERNIQRFSESSRFEINGIDDIDQIGQLFLIPQSNRYIVALYGRNGEGISNEKIQITLYPSIVRSKTFSFELTTNENGLILINSDLSSYKYVEAHWMYLDSLSVKWDIHKNRQSVFQSIPRQLNILNGESVSIPYFVLHPNDIQYALYDAVYSKTFHDHIEYDTKNGYLIIKNLEKGRYILKVSQLTHSTKITVNVMNKANVIKFDNNKYNIDSNKIIQLSKSNTLQISNIEKKSVSSVLNIKLNGHTSRTKVDVIFTHLYPEFDLNKLITRIYTNELYSKMGVDNKNNYLPQIEMDEEYRYVLERQNDKEYIGNSLERPSFLVKPLKVADTTSITQQAKKGGSFVNRNINQPQPPNMNDAWFDDAWSDDAWSDVKSDVKSQGSGGGGSHEFEVEESGTSLVSDQFKMEFVSQNGSVVFTNLIPNNDGIVSIDISKYNVMENYQYFVRVMVFDDFENQQRIIKDYYLENDEKQQDIEFNQYVDDRMNVGLNPENTYIQSMDIVLMQKGNKYDINDFKGSEISSISSFEQLFDFYVTISQDLDQELLEWIWLKQWNQFNLTQKMEKYDKYLSHELHLFLFKKDIEFFENICIKHIQSKLNKDLMDYFFLNDMKNLNKYAQFYYFQQLNPMEQILLIQSLNDNPMKQSVLKYYMDLFDSITISEDEIHYYISAALLSSSESEKNDPISDQTNDPSVAPEKNWINRQKMKKKKLFEQIDKTVEYQETYYWNHKNKLFIPQNKFWCEYAMYLLSNHNKIQALLKEAFLSEWFFTAQSTTNELLLSLILIDLPFNDQNKHHISYIYNDKKSINHNVTIKASSATILFIKQIKQQISETKTKTKTKCRDKKQVKEESILVHTNYFDPKERYITNENNEKIEKFIDPLNMKPLKLYAMSVVITVISSVAQTLNVLTQIPTGSLPVITGYRTKVHFINMEPYTVKKLIFYFYFPSIGTFQQYPVIIYKTSSSISSDVEIIASSSPSQNYNHQVIIKDVDQQNNKITNIHSWNQVSLYGDNNEILQYLSTHNLHKTDLSRIYYKLKESIVVYDMILKLCMDQNYVDDTIWALQFYWINEKMSVNELKPRIEIIKQQLISKLLSEHNQIPMTNPSELLSLASIYGQKYKKPYIYLEYIPLINARTHLLGQQRQILNLHFKRQYETFLNNLLSHSTSILDVSLNHLLSASYYLLLQDRYYEAVDIYKIIKYYHNYKINKLDSFLFDYFKVYISLYDESIFNKNKISNILKRYENITLIKSKAKLLNEMKILLNDIESDEITNFKGSKLKDTDTNYQDEQQEFLDFEINKDDRSIIVKSQNVDKFEINFYVINMEILFSMNPSLILSSSTNTNQHSIFSYIQPTMTINININIKEMDNKLESNTINIPIQLKNENLFIQIVSSTLIISKPYLDHQLIVQIQQNYGKLKILTQNEENGKLIFVSNAYIKVFAFINNQYEFYKDGYSDIRGSFHYALISTNQLDKTKKFAIFISHKQYGSLVKEADIPKR